MKTLKRYAKLVLASVAAALTTPEAVKVEKSIAIVALTRAAILMPAAGFVIAAVVKALGG